MALYAVGANANNCIPLVILLKIIEKEPNSFPSIRQVILIRRTKSMT
ncbi:hypothetical protein ACXQBX_03320 [Staphylococcus argenteus]|nr:hypothetical protein [Staphylococcus argenteus]BBD87151.1 hypothetical protein SA58113_2366 [Staphylococcus argenteus]